MNEDRLITPDSVGRVLNLSASAVIRRFRSGVLLGFKVHSSGCAGDGCHCPWRTSRSALADYLRRMQQYDAARS